MRGLWNEKNWHLDGNSLLMPNGRKLDLKEILQWRADVTEGRYDLTGKWCGWRIRQQWLIPPNGSMRQHRIAQHVLARTINEEDYSRKELSRRQLTLF